ncbi:MAG: hypothetical protein GPJ54_18190 [Candidatus Heimdallarchaeota archaeon]|nr:hypothetical protein [Candidatus Heimdallarchaeota archaeon]
MKFKIKAEIIIFEEVDLTILDKTISPENSSMPENSGIVTSKIQDNKFKTTIEGEMTIGRLIFTLDDIIKTSILAKNISDQT